MKKLYAVVKEKGSKDYQLIERDCYSSKKEYESDLRANGYMVRKIYSENEFKKL